MDAETKQCACGARLVGEPILEPSDPRPALGAAIGAVSLGTLSLAALWMKPFLALAPLSIYFGVRAVRSARRDPGRFGGVRTARAGLALGGAVAIGVSTWMIAGIPRALQNRRDGKAAATRAEIYHVAGLVQEYHEVYGAYPDRLSDLTKLDGVHAVPELRDSWEKRIVYSGFTSDIASTSGRPSLNANFELRSFGPDGEPNTPDDVIMRDGAFVDEVVNPSPTLPVTVPVTKRVR